MNGYVLQSYIKNERDFELLKKASKEYFSSISSIYHYLHMAKGNYREYLQGDFVKAKKYFYVLRPILACVWIKKNNESPPIEFDVLLENINDNDLIREINYLLKRKRTGIELGEEKAIPIINEYINDQISELENYTGSYNHKDKPSSEYLDNVFWELLN